jgi:hypothetical protein
MRGQFLPKDGEITVIETNIEQEHENKTDADNKVDAIAAALKEDSTAYLNVHRRITQNSPEEFVANFDADKYDFGQLLSYLQENYGGGDYRVRLYAKGRIKANKLLQIAHKVKPSNTPQINPTGDAAQILNVVLQEMRNSQEKMFQTLQQKTDSRGDLLKDMALFKELFGGNSAPVNPFEAMKPMLEFMTMMGFQPPGAGGEHEKGFMDVLEKALPVFLKGMQQPAPRIARAQIPAHVPGTAQIVPKPNPVEPLSDTTPQEKELRDMLTILVKAARKNGDQYTYASMMFDQFDAGIIAQIAQTPGVLDMLGTIDPDVIAFKPWFLLLIEHLKAQLGLESEVAADYDDLTDAGDGDNNAGNTSPESPNNEQ